MFRGGRSEECGVRIHSVARWRGGTEVRDMTGGGIKNRFLNNFRRRRPIKKSSTCAIDCTLCVEINQN